MVAMSISSIAGAANSAGKAYSAGVVRGQDVNLAATEGGHFGFDTVAGADPVESFGTLLQKAIGNVNAAELDSYEKTNAMVATPDKVDISDVMVSFAKAQSAVNFTKAVTDRILNIFRELTNLR